MKHILFLLLFLPFMSNGQTWVFKSVDSLRGKNYLTQYAPAEGAAAVVDQTTKGGVIYRKRLWYTLVFGNTDLDDSLTTVYCDYFGGPYYAWKLVDSADLALLTLPLGTTTQVLNGLGSPVNVSNLFVSWGLSMMGSDLKLKVKGASGDTMECAVAMPAQVNSDWNSGSGVSQILNKPSIPAAQVQPDWNASSGMGQILNKPSIPALKRVDNFSGTTDASGNYTVTYSSAFSATPVLSYNIVTNNNLMDWKLTASSASGFTINVYTRNTGNVLTNLLGALTGALLTGTTPASGVSIKGIATEQ